MLSRKQVKSLLEVMGNDGIREILECAYIDIYKGRTVLVACDAYKLVALNIPDAEGNAIKVGERVPRDALVRWYKLAKASDTFTTADIAELSVEGAPYVPWQEVLAEKTTDVGAAITAVAFNAAYALSLQGVAGEPLTYKLNGTDGPMCANTDNGSYVLMPLRNK